MDEKKWNVLNKITFKTQGYRKNFDLITKNENIITEYVGDISLLRISQKKLPIIIGEYTFSVWDISLARLLNIDLENLLNAHHMIDAYNELSNAINKGIIDVITCNKIVLIHSIVIHSDFRKMEISEEFVESIYRDFHSPETLILAHVRPFQNNIHDLEYYTKFKNVVIPNDFSSENKYKSISAINYYSLQKFIDKPDIEKNEYKIFAVANRCGFTRINDSHIFQLIPDTIINRIKNKKETQKLIDESWEKESII